MSPSGPVYIVYSSGPSIEPCGTPQAKGRLVDCSLPMDTNCFLSARYNVNHWQAAPYVWQLALERARCSLPPYLPSKSVWMILLILLKLLLISKSMLKSIHPLNLVMQRTVNIFIPAGCPWSWKDKGWRHWWGSRVRWHLWLCCWSFQDDWWKGSTIRT